jgi:cap1 methyltransferase
MCDGGFSVEGKEEIQEVMSKRLYLCQFIVGLSLARVEDGDSEPGGNYLCKLFDVFTPFSAGLIYLMYIAFRKITLHKPNTSRPANSERFDLIVSLLALFRYIFCEGLTEFGSTVIKNYLVHINDELEKMGKETTILEVVPFEFMEQDSVFFDYFVKNNEEYVFI